VRPLLPAPGFRRLALPTAALIAALLINSLADLVPSSLALGRDYPLIGILREVSAAALWLAGAWVAARLVDLLLRRAAIASPRSAPYPRLLSDLIHAAAFLLAALGILTFIFNQTATGLIATSSVMIAVIGFALRYVISDVFSGIALSFDHPYRIGDWIETSPGAIGKVVEITWRTTRLVTRDGVALVVPNGLIATGRLANYTGEARTFRSALRLSLTPELAVARAKRILLAGALTATRTYPDLRPDVLLSECSDAGVVYMVRFWVPDYGQENMCRDAVLEGVLHALRSVGLAPSASRREIISMESENGSGRTPSEMLLLDSELFGAFSTEERALLAEHLVERRFRQGATIVHQGEAADTLFFVCEGALEVRSSNAAGNEIAINRLGAGDLFGEMSLLTGEPRSASVVALTAAVLYELDKEYLAPLLARRPELGEALADLMLARQRSGRAQLDARDGEQALEQRSTSARLLGKLRSFLNLPEIDK
jgi:small-conductance mechanosensitive channel/CRP-like cAMP-binding protein